ncbi:hypothetical protein L1987_07796 [Smallanthus sonchifolius]|uniref:Uncharacterized protein n=1 Tax=Smallanthus sonchifolius TaxID=185202 RepID=A0ACB9JIT4_9ASTR|nr:hypothetical protein L1987_07796 [Smallanthus sonchifolius]
MLLNDVGFLEMVVDTLMECVKDGNAGKLHSSGYHKFIHTMGEEISSSSEAEKVQHPWLQGLMMSDLRNLQAFALCVQKTDTKFDLFSACKEMGKQVVRCCLEHASSAAKTLFMSECAVVEIREPEPVPVGDPIDNSGT